MFALLTRCEHGTRQVHFVRAPENIPLLTPCALTVKLQTFQEVELEHLEVLTKLTSIRSWRENIQREGGFIRGT